MAPRAHPALLALLVMIVAASVLGSVPAPAAAREVRPPGILAAPAILTTDPPDGAVINTSSPRITVTYESGNVTAVAFLLDGANVTNGGTFTATTFLWSYPFALLEGPHRADFTLWDNTSSSSSASWTFTVDTVPPPLEATLLAPEHTNLLTVTLAGLTEPGATVLVDGVPAVVAGDGSFTATADLTSEGVNAIVVVALDAAGNSASLVRTIIRDTVPPLLNVFMPLEGMPWNSTSVFASGLVEPGSRLLVNGLEVAVNLTSGAWATFVPMYEGTGAVEIVAIDSAGNVAREVRRVLVDTVAPRITLMSPATLLTNRSAVVVSGFVSESVAALIINDQAHPLPLYAPYFEFSMTLTAPDGLFPIRIVAVDFAGNIATMVAGVNVDTTAPTVVVTNPPEGTETDDLSVEVRGTVDDPTATVVVNGLLVRPDASGTWSTVVALRGSHQPILTTITVYAVDAAGNRGNVVTRGVTYTSPIPDLEDGVVSTRQDIAALRDFLTYGLLGVLAIALIVQATLYSRLRNRVRERKAPAPETRTADVQEEVEPKEEEGP